MRSTQFLVCLAHSAYAVWEGDRLYPRAVASVQIVVMVQMFVLFRMFERRAYRPAAVVPSSEAPLKTL